MATTFNINSGGIYRGTGGITGNVIVSSGGFYGSSSTITGNFTNNAELDLQAMSAIIVNGNFTNSNTITVNTNNTADNPSQVKGSGSGQKRGKK